MSTVLSPPESLEQPPALQPVWSPRFALGLKHIAVTVLFGVFFLYFNYQPLWHTDLWGHVAYGKWMLSHRTLPAEDPFMPLAEGVRAVDTAWLAKVILALVQQAGGAEWLSNLYALAVLAAHLILLRVFYRQTGRLGLSMLGIVLSVAVAWSRLPFARPEIFGVICFVILLLLIARSEAARTGTQLREHRDRPDLVARARPWSLWLGIPSLFLVWTNLHGSFVCGLAVLGCYAFGRMIDVFAQSRSVGGVINDQWVRRWLLLTELALAATLVNPYGIDLWISTVGIATGGNLSEVMEWAPLVIWSGPGLGFALSLVLLAVVLRQSPRRVRATEVLLLAVFATAASARLRMIAWYAPVVAFVLMPHIRAIARRWRWLPARRTARPTTQSTSVSGRYALVWALAVWLTFAFSGVSQPILGGQPRPPERLYSQYTPRGVTEFLRENPPEGLVFNPQVWGDWLVWDGPAGMQVFVTSYIHLVPRRVWRDYLHVYHARAGWQEILDRYRVTTLVIDKERQPPLSRLIRRVEGWTRVYEDDLGLVLKRKGQ